MKASYRSGYDQHIITQDQLDIIRQEYLYHGITTPERNNFTIPYSTAHFTEVQIRGDNAYSEVLGAPGEFAEIIRNAYNRLINDDVQEIPVGTSGLNPMAIVISPGTNIQTIGPILDTLPCNGAPNLTTCDDYDVNNTIVAGPNGIAETYAVNQLTDNNLRISSAWRNPQRNEAVGGELTSRHQYGNALDLVIYDVPGKTRAQLFCILQTAANGIPGFKGFAEHFGSQRDCNEADVTHVHVQQ
jgi:hypothetical protein